VNSFDSSIPQIKNVMTSTDQGATVEEEALGSPVDLEVSLQRSASSGGGKESIGGESSSDSSHPTSTPPSAMPPSASEVDDSWSFEALPDDFNKSPEPLSRSPKHSPSRQGLKQQTAFGSSHSLHQIEENASIKDYEEFSFDLKPLELAEDNLSYFTPYYRSTRWVCAISKHIFRAEAFCFATWIGFWSLFTVTMGVSTITPIRDAIALQLGVKHIPKLTLASSVLAFFSSVPIGWLFEAPDPSRRKLWKKMGLTRGETQGSSLALFYRFFALSVASYAFGFTLVELIKQHPQWIPWLSKEVKAVEEEATPLSTSVFQDWLARVWQTLGEGMYIAFFLVVHLMKLHSISLVWGVTTEAMEYEDVARKAKEMKLGEDIKPARTRLQRLALVGFGGTLGGILGRYVNAIVDTVHNGFTHSLISSPSLACWQPN
jgi:hypothetical protein